MSYSMIATGVTILTTTLDSCTGNMKYSIIHKEVTIGEGGRIGANATILPGVTVLKKTIVGTGAIVVNDVREGKVVFSPAAKVIRNRTK